MVLACKKCSQGLYALHFGAWSTCVGYESLPGHAHDDNCLTRSYGCANGHVIILSIRRKCHACDWLGKTACFCHPGEKLPEWPDDAPR